MKKGLFLLFLFCTLGVAVKSQNALWYEISYDRPSGNLFWVYSSGIGHRVGYSFDINDEDWEWGGFIGLNRWKPKQDTFYYRDGNGFGTALFSNYTILQLGANLQRPFFIEKRIQPIIGLDFGYFYYAMEYEEHDSTHDLQGSVIEGRAAFCPHTGLQTIINDEFRVALHARYNFYISIGSSDSRDMNFNPSVGKFDTFWTGSLVVGYIH